MSRTTFSTAFVVFVVIVNRARDVGVSAVGSDGNTDSRKKRELFSSSFYSFELLQVSAPIMSVFPRSYMLNEFCSYHQPDYQWQSQKNYGAIQYSFLSLECF